MMKRPCCAGSSVTLVMTDTAHVTVFIEPVDLVGVGGSAGGYIDQHVCLPPISLL